MNSETIHEFLVEAFEPERADRIIEFVNGEFGGRPDTAQRATVALMAIISAMLPNEVLAHELLKGVYEQCDSARADWVSWAAAQARAEAADQEPLH